LDILIENTEAHFKQYDVADVFSIVFPDSQGNLLRDSSGSIETVNLFSHFTELTVAQVAASNLWYSE
jgi:cbb3-type cytochrome oxidase subunit 1